MPQIPYVRSGEKLHITAKTLNAVAEHINGAVTISAGKPNKGGSGGGVPVVQDNTSDIFKIYQYDTTVNAVKVKAGIVYLGSLQAVTAESSSISVSTTKRYIYVQVSYSNGALSAQINYSSSVQVPDNNSNYRYTLGCVYLDANNVLKIEQWHYPSPVIIYNRWIG